LKFFITLVPIFGYVSAPIPANFPRSKMKAVEIQIRTLAFIFCGSKQTFSPSGALPFTQSANDEGAWLNKGNPVPCVFHGPHTKTSKAAAAAVANETLLLRRYCDGIKPHDARRARSVCLI
jgi:hypothetical protein